MNLPEGEPTTPSTEAQRLALEAKIQEARLALGKVPVLLAQVR